MMRIDKGLYIDGHPQNQPEGTYRDLKNGSLVLQKGAVFVEKGTELIDSITGDPLKVLGSIPLDGDSHIVFSIYTDFPSSSEIGILDIRNETYTALLKDGSGNDNKLDFDEDTIIQGTYKINGQGERIIYWTDNLNPPRFLNIDTLDLAVPPTIDFNVEILRIFPQLNEIGKISDTDGISVIDGGGALLTGSYFFAIAYVSDDGATTNYFEVIGPIPVNSKVFDSSNPHGFDGAPQDTSTSKSIIINLEELNTDFSNLKVAVLKAGNLADVRFLSNTPINSIGNATISYTGAEDFEDGSLDEVLINFASYEKAKAITQLDSVLYLGNLEQGEDIGYQKYANGIEVEPVVKVTGQLEEIGSAHVERQLLFHDGNIDHRKLEKNRESRGYRRGDVYALYISFVRKDGSETAAYHIPGRAPEAGELDDILSVPVGTDPATYQELSDEVGGAKHYQLVGRTTWPNMAYWENENEVYPNIEEFDIWETDIDGNGVDTGNTLRGENVRHHYFPDSVSSGDDNTKGFFQGYTTTPNIQITGFKVKNVQIPNEIRDSIIGYKVYYARRTLLNRRIIDQGMLHYAAKDEGPNPFTDRVVYSGHWPDPPDAGDFKVVPNLATSQPFHMIKQQEKGEGINLNLITHLHEIYHLSEYREWDTDNPSFILPTPEEYVPKDRMLLLDFKTYLEKGGVVNIPTFSPDLANVGGPSCIAFKLREDYGDSAQTRNTLVNFCQFRRNLYNPFTSQELIYTQYFVPVGDVGNTFNSPNIFGGDIYVTFYGQVAILSNITDGGAVNATDRNVTQYVCESPDNIAFRHREEPDPLPEGETSLYYNYWPLNFPGTPRIDFEDDPPWINAISYNDEYSVLNNIKPAFPDNPQRVDANKFPTRVIRSVQDVGETLEDQYRIFRADDFKDFPKNRGEITVLKGLNSILVVHMERSLFRTRGREELVTGDFRAFLGAGDIFSVEPEEIFNTEGGYAGCQDPLSAIVTPSGYFFIDREEGRVYKLSDGLVDISSIGIKKFFQDNLDREFISTEGRLISGYDRRNNRVFFTRFDGIDSWTLSFLPTDNIWESFHEGDPDFYINGLRDLIAFKGPDIYKRGGREDNVYFGQSANFEFERVVNQGPQTNKVVRSIFIDSTFLDPANSLKEVVDKYPDTIQVKSDHQDTGLINLIPFPTDGHNARRTNRIWKVNGLRDSNAHSDLNGVLPDWATKRRMIGKHHLVRIIHDNSDGYDVYLFDLDAFQKLSIR